jgi:hypothetical protein
MPAPSSGLGAYSTSYSSAHEPRASSSLVRLNTSFTVALGGMWLKEALSRTPSASSAFMNIWPRLSRDNDGLVVLVRTASGDCVVAQRLADRTPWTTQQWVFHGKQPWIHWRPVIAEKGKRKTSRHVVLTRRAFRVPSRSHKQGSGQLTSRRPNLHISGAR